MNVDELSGTALNEAVAKCLGIVHIRHQGQVVDRFGNPLMYIDDWSLAGEIIERECIELQHWGAHSVPWSAWIDEKHHHYGTTPLIAAMRCFVASKQGEQDANEDL